MGQPGCDEGWGCTNVLVEGAEKGVNLPSAVLLRHKIRHQHHTVAATATATQHSILTNAIVWGQVHIRVKRESVLQKKTLRIFLKMYDAFLSLFTATKGPSLFLVNQLTTASSKQYCSIFYFYEICFPSHSRPLLFVIMYVLRAFPTKLRPCLYQIYERSLLHMRELHPQLRK